MKFSTKSKFIALTICLLSFSNTTAVYSDGDVIDEKSNTGGYGGQYTLDSGKMYQIGNQMSDLSMVNDDDSSKDGYVNRMISDLWSNKKVAAQISLSLQANYHLPAKSPSEPSPKFLQQKTDNGISPATTKIRNNSGMSYTAFLQIGTPKQTFELTVDNNSPITWIPSAECMTPGCSGKMVYEHDKSSTYSQNGSSVSMDYPIGQVKGYLSEDSAQFLNTNLKPAVFRFVEATDLAFWFNRVPADGVLGLGWETSENSAKDQKQATSIINEFYRQGLLTENSFSVFLNNESNKDGSQLILGGYDQRYFEGKLDNHQIADEKKWNLQLDGIYSNNILIASGTSGEPIKAEFSLASSKIQIRKELFAKMGFGANPEPSQFCSDLDWSTLPDIDFVFGGVKYSLTSRMYVSIQNVNNDPKQPEICQIGFVEMYDDKGHPGIDIVIAVPFFRNYYSYYNFDKKIIGLAKVKPNTQ